MNARDVAIQDPFEPKSPTCYFSPKLQGRTNARKGGHGVFSRAPIEAGELLVVWGGEVVGRDRLARLPEGKRRRLAIQVEEGLYLLTTREGPADWINHSCDPNAWLSGQIVLLARREIRSGEEICFDYAMCDASPYDEFDCRCGARSCRGRITSRDWMRADLRERYDGHFSPYVQRLIDEERAAARGMRIASGYGSRARRRR